MPIPRFFVNGPRVLDPISGIALCGLDPPFLQHQTIEVLVHCATGGVELRHFKRAGHITEILLCVNRDMVYLTVEPGDILGLYWIAGVQATAVQGSLYVF